MPMDDDGFRAYIPFYNGDEHIGMLDVSTYEDGEYQGLDIELITDDEDETKFGPRVLFEYDKDVGWRVLVWGDKNSEDYTDEIVFH